MTIQSFAEAVLAERMKDDSLPEGGPPYKGLKGRPLVKQNDWAHAQIRAQTARLRAVRSREDDYDHLTSDKLPRINKSRDGTDYGPNPEDGYPY